MRYFIAVFFLLVCKTALSQQWHPANKKLVPLPKTNGYYTTIGHFSKYDSVSCTYVTSRSSQLHRGFKFVVVNNGRYSDDAHTFRVFYDEHFKKVHHVERFYFE